MGNYYVISSWVSACVKGLELAGLDTKRLLTEADINQDDFKRFYLPLGKVKRLFTNGRRLFGDDIGLLSRLGLVPSSFHYLSLAALSCYSIADALNLIVKYNGYLTNAVNYMTRQKKETFSFGFYTAAPMTIEPVIFDAIIATAVRTIRFIDPSSKVILCARVPNTDPTQKARLQAYLKCPITIGSHYEISLDAEQAHKPSMHFNELVLKENERLLLKSIQNEARLDVVIRLRSYLERHLDTPGLTIYRAAQAFNMSVSQLQHALRKQSTSFKKELDQMRRFRANELVMRSWLPVSHIADTLGFSDAANFTRAFKRWYGCSPDSFRKSQL